MSKTKNHVHPGYYKVAGSGRQGEDVIHDRQKSLVAASHAMQEHQAPYPERVAAPAKPLAETETALELEREPTPRAPRASRKPARQARTSARGRKATPRKAAPRKATPRKAPTARKSLVKTRTIPSKSKGKRRTR